jgi:hypothetical protein
MHVEFWTDFAKRSEKEGSAPVSGDIVLTGA